MKIIHSLLLNLLFGLVVFIPFLLVFEHIIVVPPALQVFGRMHPLLLHFPIVLLVLAWLLACFGNRLVLPLYVAEKTVYALLFASTWSAAITVVAGLVLAQEGGYEGNGFRWHKWMGVTLFLLSILLLGYHHMIRRSTGRSRLFFKIGLSILLVVLLLTGHFGAALTHGDDYLLGPLRRDKKTLDVATAVIFPDLVYPILEAKCLGCHNAGKTKGGLVLADTASLMRGGDSGPALVKSSLEESLIIERLMLELDHEHRMPPKGKPQLSSDELALVRAWVASGADFNIPLAALPANDTIRQLAVALYPFVENVYDFPAADNDIIKSLNSPYVVIRPLAQSSPALSASFFGKTSYTSQSLQSLLPVGSQLVELTLSGMPLLADDRDVLAAFTNLRELFINDTPLDDGWCDVLSSLPELQKLSVSGTAITETGLATLLAAPALRAVYVWNTRIDTSAVEKLQQKYKHIKIERGYVDDGRTVLPLNDPIIAPLSNFFRDSLLVTLSHPVPGVELRFTTDGSEPDSVYSPIYHGPLRVSEDTYIRVKGYKSGWVSSSEAARTFHRSSHTPHSLELLTAPNPKYKARGTFTLYDRESGGDNHADGKWMGFYGEPMITVLSFDTAIDAQMVGISVKQHYGRHIYPPQQVDVWGGTDSTDAQLLARFRPELRPDAPPRRLLEIPVAEGKHKYLRIEVKPYVRIPAEYPAAGNPAWIFVDEIIVQ